MSWLILFTLLSIIYLWVPNTLKGIIAIDNIIAFTSDTTIIIRRVWRFKTDKSYKGDNG